MNETTINTPSVTIPINNNEDGSGDSSLIVFLQSTEALYLYAGGTIIIMLLSCCCIIIYLWFKMHRVERKLVEKKIAMQQQDIEFSHRLEALNSQSRSIHTMNLSHSQSINTTPGSDNDDVKLNHDGNKVTIALDNFDSDNTTTGLITYNNPSNNLNYNNYKHDRYKQQHVQSLPSPTPISSFGIDNDHETQVHVHTDVSTLPMAGNHGKQHQHQHQHHNQMTPTTHIQQPLPMNNEIQRVGINTNTSNVGTTRFISVPRINSDVVNSVHVGVPTSVTPTSVATLAFDPTVNRFVIVNTRINTVSSIDFPHHSNINANYNPLQYQMYQQNARQDANITTIVANKNRVIYSVQQNQQDTMQNNGKAISLLTRKHGGDQPMDDHEHLMDSDNSSIINMHVPRIGNDNDSIIAQDTDINIENQSDIDNLNMIETKKIIKIPWSTVPTRDTKPNTRANSGNTSRLANNGYDDSEVEFGLEYCRDGVTNEYDINEMNHVMNMSQLHPQIVDTDKSTTETGLTNVTFNAITNKKKSGVKFQHKFANGIENSNKKYTYGYENTKTHTLGYITEVSDSKSQTNRNIDLSRVGTMISKDNVTNDEMIELTTNNDSVNTNDKDQQNTNKTNHDNDTDDPKQLKKQQMGAVLRDLNEEYVVQLDLGHGFGATEIVIPPSMSDINANVKSLL